MLSRNHPDRIQIAFDDTRLVANAGLLLPASLARHLGLSQLVQEHLDLGDAPGRANTGDKIMTLVASALAGGECIDDADALRSGGTASAVGCVVKAPSTLGTFLRSFRWAHVRQLDRVSRELLARAWAAGGGPGDRPLTIDLDSTICETYGLAKEGALHHGYTGQRGYHPLLAVAAGTGEVLMARLREGRANTARGAAHFSGRFPHRRPQLRLLRFAKGGGEPPVCSKIKAVGPPSPKAAAHLPMVWGSRSSAAAVQPWVSSKMAYHRSRSRGVGARIIRRRRSLTPICHCSRNRSISLAPITIPSPTPGQANPVPP